MEGERTYFLYSDEGLVAEYDEEGNEIRSYGYKPNSTWGTDPLWLKQDGEYYWYQNDHLGTPQKLVDSTGTIVWSATYTAFGEAIVDVETVTNNLRFPGQYFDVETGLHYNFQRYYDPEIGRYTRTDPIGFDGGDANLYAYVWNNPENWIDPLGLELIPKGTPEQKAIIGEHLRRLQKYSPNTGGNLIKMLKANEKVIEIWINNGGWSSYNDWADPAKIEYDDEYCSDFDPERDPLWKNVPPELVLGHELIHAWYDVNRGLCFGWRECWFPGRYTGPDDRAIGVGEWPDKWKGMRFTEYTENAIREEYAKWPEFSDMVLRPKYKP